MGKKKGKSSAAAVAPVEEQPTFDFASIGQADSDSDEGEKGLSKGKLTRKHRDELREFKAKSEKMLSEVPKKDKEKRKEVQKQIDDMERELKARHKQELDGLEVELLKQTEALRLEEERKQKELEEAKKKKAEKNRQKNQRKMEKESERRQNEEEELAAAGGSAKQREEASLKQQLRSQLLKVNEVQPDGHCMYRAVSQQMQLLNLSIPSKNKAATSITFQDLRAITADYLRANRDSFIAFLETDSGDLMSEAEYQAWCDKVENTAEWGGHVELQALSEVLQSAIHIHTAEAPPVVIGVNYDSKARRPINLSYHKHAYGLGEHYNSVVPTTAEEIAEEEEKERQAAEEAAEKRKQSSAGKAKPKKTAASTSA